MFVTPPQEADNDLSEEDSADEDYTEFDLSNLGRKLLYAEAEAYRQGATLQVKRKQYLCLKVFENAQNNNPGRKACWIRFLYEIVKKNYNIFKNITPKSD